MWWHISTSPAAPAITLVGKRTTECTSDALIGAVLCCHDDKFIDCAVNSHFTDQLLCKLLCNCKCRFTRNDVVDNNDINNFAADYTNFSSVTTNPHVFVYVFHLCVSHRNQSITSIAISNFARKKNQLIFVKDVVQVRGPETFNRFISSYIESDFLFLFCFSQV